MQLNRHVKLNATHSSKQIIYFNLDVHWFVKVKTLKMELAFTLLLLLPVVFSTPQKRLIFDTLFQTDELKTLVDGIVGTLGTDPTEAACEAECHALIQADHLLQFGCPLACKRIWLCRRDAFKHDLILKISTIISDCRKTFWPDLVFWHVNPIFKLKLRIETIEIKTLKMKLAFALLLLLPVVFSTPQKRLVFDTLFQTDELKALVDGIVSTVGPVGSDATEQACETECHTLIQGDHILQFGCPLISKYLKMKLAFALLLLLPVVFSTPQKRLIFDTLFQTDELKTLVDGIVVKTLKMKLAFALLLLLPVVFSTPQKRLIFDTLFQTDELKTLVDQIVNTVGTDATEQACETECHTLIQEDHLLQFGCPLICKSFQSLVHRFGHVTVTQTTV
ncbi:unnamed protein product [Mytilus edulis]|uniref:Uncharacterized protein n=1 Tax=Mytilus edulis TaxID=6550 RepID=A0A8S3S6G4_MYTED|nr:unnamed protein product [Mytilus edulis]